MLRKEDFDGLDDLDLDAYLQRIGYRGSLTPELETLHGLHFSHATSIPFENLDVLLGRPISLELSDIQDKLVYGVRGGYCFEQNRLLAAALMRIGFQVTGLSGRVRRGSPAIRPRTHMILSVAVDGESWLADVGFGSEGLLFPVPLKNFEAIQQHAWTYRLVREGDLHVLQTLYDEGWFDLYAFTLEPQYHVDYMMGNYYTYSHPRSPFTNTLLVQRTTADVRIILLNRQRLTARAGVKEIQTLTDDAALLDVLRADFGLSFPDGTRFNFVERENPLS
jgi:N-hydroxyarylamine O-acetyltransferase